MPDRAVRNKNQIAKVRSFDAVERLVIGSTASSWTIGGEDITGPQAKYYQGFERYH